jgi:integrase
MLNLLEGVRTLNLRKLCKPGLPAGYIFSAIINLIGRTGYNTRNKLANNVTKQFNVISAMARVEKGTFHDIRKTSITSWFRQSLSEHDIMTIASHANFSTTHKFYLAAADDLIARARKATSHQVSQEPLQKCYQSNRKGVAT